MQARAADTQNAGQAVPARVPRLHDGEGQPARVPRLVAAEHDDYEPAQVKSGIPGWTPSWLAGWTRGPVPSSWGRRGRANPQLPPSTLSRQRPAGERAALFLFEESRKTLLARSAGLGQDVQGLPRLRPPIDPAGGPWRVVGRRVRGPRPGRGRRPRGEGRLDRQPQRLSERDARGPLPIAPAS